MKSENLKGANFVVMFIKCKCQCFNFTIITHEKTVRERIHSEKKNLEDAIEHGKIVNIHLKSKRERLMESLDHFYKENDKKLTYR